MSDANANPFRAAAWEALAAFDEDISLLVREGGADALRRISGVRPGIAAAILEILRTAAGFCSTGYAASTTPSAQTAAIGGGAA